MWCPICRHSLDSNGYVVGYPQISRPPLPNCLAAYPVVPVRASGSSRIDRHLIGASGDLQVRRRSQTALLNPGRRTATTPSAAPSGVDLAAYLPHLVDEFLNYLASYRRASPLTLDAYRRDLTRLNGFLQSRGLTLEADSLEPKTLEAFAVSLSGYSPATINRSLNATSSFCSFLLRAGRLARNPVDGIVKPKKQRKLPSVPSLEDCRHLLHAADGERERAMLLLLMGAGLRRAELLDLKLRDLSVDLRQLTVSAKGDKQRLIFLPDEAASALGAYLAIRTAESDWLFVNRAGQRIGNTSFCRLFRRILRRAGLEDKDFTPHRLRHFYATQLLRSAVDVKTVQEMLGHADLGTTSLYLHSDDNSKKAAAAALPSFVVDVVGGGAQS